jgi:hypothetical protein
VSGKSTGAVAHRPERDEPANALVVDWDYFFPNPSLSKGGCERRDWLLFDWASGEADDGTDWLVGVGMGQELWQIRARSFLCYGFDLPMCAGWKGFWDRFTGLAGVPMRFADSNLFSAPEYFLPEDGGRWDRIDLYDAHHDSGYKHQGHVHCGNWMLWHRKMGTRDLRVHYPAWRNAVDGAGEAPPVIKVDRSIDDGAPVDVRYQRVFVCRSGSWVPPWCDEDFDRFVDSYPGPWVAHSATDGLNLRLFDEAQVRAGLPLERIARRGPEAMARLVELSRQFEETGLVPDLSGDPEMAAALRMVTGRAV